ncbi:MAG: type I-E CRISPR-associated protein Cse2/CasB [Sphingomonas adhaesiva]|uniref:type I-E CRISPR-associated protein Cse2/CasB n=1 Tax=Sphingomonas adhaesiva TaxID=28212 RepID=UPI002FFA4ACD
MEIDDDAPAPSPQDTESPVEVFTRAISRLTNGRRAQLRRAYLTNSLEADGIVIGLLHQAAVNVRPDAEAQRPWKLIAHCAALLAGTGNVGAPAHVRGKSLGRALQAANVSEHRMLRLTSARGRVQESLIVQAMRRIEREGKGPIDMRVLFHLIRYADDGRGRDARLRIAQDYYAAQARSQKDNSNDD